MCTGGIMKSVFVLVVGVAFAVASTHAVAAPNGPLRSILSKLQSSATTDQYRTFEEAINASPALTEQINELATTGQLATFTIGERSALPMPGSPFSAYVSGTTWAFTPEFVQQQAKTRYMDVVMPGDILGDNMVFALGELAYNTKWASQVATSEKAVKAQFAYGAQTAKLTGAHVDGTDFLKQMMALHIGNTAMGFIQGWNDMLDAAVRENDGRQLSIRQVVSLMMNFRYRGVFMKALHAAHPLHYENDGRIEPNEANRDALIEAFKTMPLYDLQ
jgi:hypothetical protein